MAQGKPPRSPSASISVFETASFFARKKTEIGFRFPVAVSCSKNQGGLRGGARFRRRPSSVSPKPEFCVKNQAESADDGGKPNRHTLEKKNNKPMGGSLARS